jgi:hypothetical protein
MKKELTEKLRTKYPTVYKNLYGDARYTCMAWGISVREGWYDIIDELSAVLEKHKLVAAQVKEKFGGLRFYLDEYPKDDADYKEVRDAISKAERKAYKTCEYCGPPGKPTKGGWVKVLCEECLKK